jgi:sigma-B regulation protein RsbU (phosphoserine phosphatase)
MKISRLKSLAAHLSLWIISLGALIFIAVLGANYYLSLVLLEDNVEDLTREKALSTVRKIETIFSSAAISADSLSTIVSTSGSSDQQIQQTIKAVINANPSIYGMTVALEPGTPINPYHEYSPYYYGEKNKLTFSDLADNNYDYQSQAWYSVPKQKNKPIWSEPYFDEGGGEVMMITYSTPIYLADSNIFAGIATADIKLKFLDAIIKNAKIGSHGYGVIVSKNDTIISPSSRTRQLSKDSIDQEKWQHYLNSKKDSSAYSFESPCPKGRINDTVAGTCRFTIQTLRNNSWKVIIVLPEKELTARIQLLTEKIATIAAAGLIFLLLAVIFITRYLTRPLAQLADATKDIGAGHLDAELPAAIREDEIGALTEDFGSMRESLKTYINEVKETTAKQQKLESEIQIATDIQMSMLPGSGNAFIQDKNFQLFAYLKPATSVGGDLYYFQQNDKLLHFIIGDVSGKGVPAALFMAQTVTLYTRALKDKLSPGQTFTMMNDILAENNDACMFVTALCGNINLDTGTVIMSNAGHMNPMIKQAQHSREQEVEGATALGLTENINYPDITFELINNSTLLMYTDGITEAHDKDNNQYSDERLLDFVSELSTKDAEEIGSEILSSVNQFANGTEQFDDITLLIIYYE